MPVRSLMSRPTVSEWFLEMRLLKQISVGVYTYVRMYINYRPNV